MVVPTRFELKKKKLFIRAITSRSEENKLDPPKRYYLTSKA